MSLPTNPLLYQVDYSGHEPSHYIKHEKQPAPYGEGMGYRIAIPNYGGFFADTLIVYDKNRNRLKPNFDYYATYRYEDATYRCGKEIMGAIIVVGKDPVEEVYISAQFLGGTYVTNYPATIKANIEKWFVEHPKSYPKWGEIIGEPSKYNDERFKHELWKYDSYEPTTSSLEDIYRNLLLGRVSDIEDYHEAFEKEEAKLREGLTKAISDCDTHYANTDNPHEDDYIHVGLKEGLRNLPLAVSDDPQVWGNDDSVVTPLTLSYAHDGVFGKTTLTDHEGDNNNPHNDHVTPMGGSTREEINVMVSQFLGVNATATNTTHLNGLTEDQIVEEAKTSIDTSRFTKGTLKKSLLGYNDCIKESVLVGTGMWVPLQVMIDRYKPTYTKIRFLDSGKRIVNGVIDGNLNWDANIDDYQRGRIPAGMGDNGIVLYAHNFSYMIWNGAYGLDSWFQEPKTTFLRFMGQHVGNTWPQGGGWY